MKCVKKEFDDCHALNDDGCWVWNGAVNSSGYGNKYFQGRMETAHRIAWMKYISPIPKGMYVLHKCDNRRCVNPYHLFLGTQKENLQDMSRKGRGTTIFSADDIRTIKQLRLEGRTLRIIGKVYGVRKQTIYELLKRHSA